MYRRILRPSALLVVPVVIIAGAWYAAPLALAQNAQPGCQTFPETGKTACGKFLQYWKDHGGLPQQGFPISSEFQEVSSIDGKTYTVQYFERAVFEAHPENKAPYDVLLQLLGTMKLKEKYPNGAPTGDPNLVPGQRRVFSETGKSVGGVFLNYWQKNGGLAQQGYPISEPMYESVSRSTPPIVVQYFERAVFELHPENESRFGVLLSRLGAMQFEAKYPNGQPGAVATPGTSSTPGTPGGPNDMWAGLRARPVNLPTVSPGASCPAAPGKQVSPDFGVALGDGPVYPVGFGTDGVYHYAGTNAEGGWLNLKVLWIADPSYTGPVLVRGRQVDGPGEVRFESGPAPIAELRLSQNDGPQIGTMWPNWPTYTRIKGPGCYAYQVDGETFSDVIVFRAEP
jgi:hypothetical protein